LQATDPALISLACLAACFALLAVLELRHGASGPTSDGPRIATNFGIGILSMGLTLVLPIGTVAAAVFAGSRGLGLGRLVPMPWPAMLVLLLLARSLANYGLHRLSHAWPPLWRLHRVHHADRAVDLSTALRNHPLELVPTLALAAVVIVLLAPPVPVVIAADAILFAATLWQHADIAAPAWLDCIVATPALHRLHHSTRRAAHDRNYGDFLILWDRLFGSYAAPADPGEFGLDQHRAEADHLLPQLASPFRRH